MAKNNIVLATLCVVAALLLGGLIGYVLQPEAKVVTNTVTELVNVTVIEEVEVVKDTVLQDKLDEAVKLFLDELTDEFDKYESIVRSKVDEDFSIEVTEDTETVKFSISVRKIDELTDVRTNTSYDVEVVFEEDEDPVVSY